MAQLFTWKHQLDPDFPHSWYLASFLQMVQADFAKDTCKPSDHYSFHFKNETNFQNLCL